MPLQKTPNERWPQVAFVRSYFPSIRNRNPPYGVGTATLINPHAALTAAHVIYDPSLGEQAEKFDVVFGGRVAVQNIPGVNGRVRSDWINPPAAEIFSRVDAGVIIFNQRVDIPGGDGIVPPGLVEFTETPLLDLRDQQLVVVGYPGRPGDKLYGGEAPGRDLLGQPFNGYRVQYDIPTVGGMSGGPVCRKVDLARGLVIRAVHVEEYPRDGTMGNGLMIYKALAAQIDVWAGEARRRAAV